MTTLQDLKSQIENANALGVANLNDKGVDISADATTYEIMQNIADVQSGGGNPYEVINSIINGTITEFYTEENFNDEKAKNLGSFFNSCSNMIRWAMPNNINDLGGYCFRYCNALTYIDIGRPKACHIALFYGKPLKGVSIVVRAETPPTLTGAFTGTSFDGTTVFYVPKSSLEAYKTATNWSNYADCFKAIEDYPEITGGII